MKCKRQVPAWASVAIASALGFIPLTSQAGLMLAARVNNVDICAADQNAGCSFGTTIADSNLTQANVLELGGPGGISVGGVQINGSLHSASLNPDILDTSSLSVTNNNAFTIRIELAVGATGYQDATLLFTSSSGTFRLSSGSTMLNEWYVDDLDGQGGMNPLIAQPGALVDSFFATASGAASSYSHSGGPISIIASGAYSIGNRIVFDLAPGGSLISRGQLSVAVEEVPEPGSLALVGIGGLLLSAMGRRTGRKA